MKFQHTRRSVRRTGLAALAVATLAGGTLVTGFMSTASAATAYDGVVVNEVESNGDTTDWVELYNTTGSSINLSGAILADSDNSHAFPLSGTIAAGGFAVFDVDQGVNGFGLGAADSARLFAGVSPTSGTLVSGISWSSHAPTTLGRTALGAYQNTSSSTRGAANTFPSGTPTADITGVVLNEVQVAGDPNGTGDWVELYNSTGSSIDISGAIIGDDDPGHNLTVPASTTLAADDYIAFRVDDPLRVGNFGFGATDEVHLYQPGDTTHSFEVDSYTWTGQPVETYGRDWSDPDPLTGEIPWKPTAAATYEAENDQFSAVSGPTLAGVKINEVKTGGDDVNGDWIELKNTSGSNRTIARAILSDNDNNHAMRIPAGTADLAPGAIFAIRVDDPAVARNFGLGDVDSARLFTADSFDLPAATPVDTQVWSQHAETSSGLNGSGVWAKTNNATFGAANDFTNATVEDESFIVLNEVDSSSPTGGADFIELRNTGSTTIDISGMILSDNKDDDVHVIPASTTLAAGAVYVVNPSFGLGSDDAVRLYRDNGVLDVNGDIDASAIPLDHFEWTAHAPGDTATPSVVNKSYRRSASGLGDWVVGNADPGTP